MPGKPTVEPKDSKSGNQPPPEYLDELLQFITQIDWQTKGLDDFKTIPPAHPLGPIFDSLARIKEDIDGLLHNDNGLTQGEIEYRKILENIYDAYFEVDIQGCLTFFNQPFERQLGYQKDELLHRNYQSLMDEPNAEAVSKMFNQVHQSGKPNKGFEHEFIRKDKTKIYVETSASLITDSKKKPIGFRGVIRDVTPRKLAENELKRAKEEAEASNKKLAEVNINLEKAVARAKALTEKAQASTKEKSEFLANMSHEIRTPMNAIMGFTDLIFSTRLSDKQHEFLTLIRRSNETLLGIINDILDFSKIEAGKLSLESKDFKLREVMESLCDMFSRKASEKDIELIVDLSRKVPRIINSDPLRLRQILINLITNAIKFTEKGEVIVKARLQEKSSDYVEVLYSIMDTGIGIRPERIPRLFEPFSQADGTTTRRYGGTGLGLTICKRLVEMMGGEIWAESEVNKGSRFHFKLRFAYQQRKLIDNPQPPVTLGKINALIIDDSEAIQRFLIELMKRFSFRASSAGSGEEALQKLSSEADRTKYDLAIVDWKMPGMDGIELIERMRKNPKLDHMKIIMLTAFGNERVRRQAEAVGVDAFLHKPLKQSVLFDTILDVFGKRSNGELNEPPVEVVEPALSQKFYGLRVLLVEDNKINQELAVTILEKEKLIVDIAKDGKEAIEALNKYDYEVILMDVQMPEMDGYEATRYIRGNKKYDHIPIIAMTADAMKGTREECIMAGMDDYLAKPIHVNELFTILSRWIDPEKRDPDYDHCLEMDEISVPIEDFPETLPGINVQDGLSRLGGNKDIYTKLLIRLGNDYSESTENIKALIENNDILKARKLIHTIKGLATNLSALQLYEAADNLGAEIKKNNIEQANDLLNHYQNALQIVLKSVNMLTLKYVKMGADGQTNNQEKTNENHPDPSF